MTPDAPLTGGGEGSRTPDPLNAIQVLYQLSYTPSGGVGNSSKIARGSRVFCVRVRRAISSS